MNFLKGLLLIVLCASSLILLESCSKDTTEPKHILEYQLEEGLLNNVTGLVEEEARTVWLSNSDGSQLTEPIIAPSGEIITIDIPAGIDEFTVNEIIQYTYETSELTILYTTANVTPGVFKRKELNDNFRRGEEIGTVTFKAVNRPDNSNISFSAAGYLGSNVWNVNDETFELPIYEEANYSFILLSETTGRKIFFFNNLIDGQVIDVRFDEAGIVFETVDYSNVDLDGYSLSTFTSNAYLESDTYLDGELRLPKSTNVFYIPQEVEDLKDFAFSFSAKDDANKFYSMEYFGDAPSPQSFQLPSMDITITNPDFEDLEISIVGNSTYFDFRTIQGNFGDPIINLWLSISKTPSDLAFPVLPEEIEDFFNVNGIGSFNGTSTVYQSVYFDHLDYTGFINRHHGREKEEVFNGIDKFRGHVRIIE